MKTANYIAVLAPAFALVFSGCDGTDCGAGTEDLDGTCVTAIECGAGTRLENGECLAGDGTIVCGPDTVINDDGSACIVADTACEAPAMFDAATRRCVSPGDISCGEGTELLSGRCVPACNGEFEVQNNQRTGCVPAARIQIVHASPDPALATVDIYIDADLAEAPDGTVIGNDLTFGRATPVLKVSNGAFVRVTESTSSNNEDFLLEFDGGLESRGRHILVIRGADGVSGRAPEIVRFDDARETPMGTSEIELALIHAGVDAPSVSVGRQAMYGVAAADELFTNVSYSPAGSLSYVETSSGTQALDVYPNGGGVPVASIQTSSGEVLPAAEGFAPGSAGVLVVTGYLTPEDGEPGLQVIAALPEAAGAALDAAARFQVIHASVDAPSPVDVYLGAMGATTIDESISVVDGLAYQSATPFQSFVAGVPVMVQVTAAGASALAVNAPFTPSMGQVARLVAVGGTDSVPLTVNVVTGSERAADAATIDIQMYHASTNAPTPVDVYFTGSDDGIGDLGPRTPNVSRLAFGVSSDAVMGVEFDDYRVSLTEAGSPNELVRFTAPIETVWFSQGVGEAFFAVVNGSVGSDAGDLDLTVISPAGGEGDETADGTIP